MKYVIIIIFSVWSWKQK